MRTERIFGKISDTLQSQLYVAYMKVLSTAECRGHRFYKGKGMTDLYIYKAAQQRWEELKVIIQGGMLHVQQ